MMRELGGLLGSITSDMFKGADHLEWEAGQFELVSRDELEVD